MKDYQCLGCRYDQDSPDCYMFKVRPINCKKNDNIFGDDSLKLFVKLAVKINQSNSNKGKDQSNASQ